MPKPKRFLIAAAILLGIAVLIIPVNFCVYMTWRAGTAFEVLAIAQLLAGIGALVCAVLHAVRRATTTGEKIASALLGIAGVGVGLGAPFALALADMAKQSSFPLGGAWGRPLRLRGRVLHPELRFGSDWTEGERPDVRALDPRTRAALEALWLHDAQKEHASVPAFARISWLLAAVGAPAELCERAHRAALEEIDHARRCFALAAGYGARSHAAEPMPDLLVGGLDVQGNPLELLASESLTDGCLLEDFNADVAAACEIVCEEPAVKGVLARIATEERSHAEFSWALLTWLLARADDRIALAVTRAAAELERVPRPTAVSAAYASLVAQADAAAMRRHGRIADAIWSTLWRERIAETRRRLATLMPARDARATPGAVRSTHGASCRP
ncbi:MAG TPA: hypothetical protein VGM44_01745 [Polyangiaceae bacterium]|jgi:hypothetical protein